MSHPYSETLLEHFRRPRNFGSLPHADAVHELLNPLCGDRIRLEIAVAEGRVSDVSFRGDACAICTASASLMTEGLRGLPLEDARSLGREQVLAVLGVPVPESRMRCALLPLEALQGCLAQLTGGRGGASTAEDSRSDAG
jgi:nitrogen fixation protein NifU and related proteins